MREAVSDEAGQVMLLVVGIVVVALAVVGVAADLTRAALLRRTLQSAADSAATLGGSQLDRADYYTSGGRSARLQPELADERGRALLAARAGIRWVRIRSTDEEVLVTLGGRVPTSFLRLVGIRHLDVTSRSAAAPVLGEG